MAIETIYLDRRILVSGDSSILHLHNPINLKDYIIQVVSGLNSGATSSTTYDNTTSVFTHNNGAGTTNIFTFNATNTAFTPTGNTVATNTQGAIVELQTEIDNLVTLTGVPTGSIHLGTFPGSIIPDNQNIKLTFTALETALQGALGSADNGLTEVTLTGMNKVQLGGPLIQNTKVDTATFELKLEDNIGEQGFSSTTGPAGTKMYGKLTTIEMLSSQLFIKTPSWFGTGLGPINSYGGIGRVLMNTTNGASVDFSPYTLPTTIGTNGQTLNTNASGVVTWQTPLVTGATNGLSLVSNNVELGGVLTKATTVTTTGQTFTISNGANTSSIYTDDKIDLNSVDIRVEIIPSAINIKDRNWHSGNTYGTAGKVLQNFDALTGEARFTLYALPLTDGTANQIIETDGSGQLTFVDNITDQLVYLQEFLTREPIIDRDGDTFFVVPSQLNGYQLTQYQWSVFTTDVGVFTMTLERNGVDIASSIQSVIANAQNGVKTFTAITLSTNDRIRLNTSAVSGVTPNGLTVILTLKRP